MWSMKQPIGYHGCYMKRGKLGFSITRREQHLGVSTASRGRIFRIHGGQNWQMAGDTEIPVPGHVN